MPITLDEIQELYTQDWRRSAWEENIKYGKLDAQGQFIASGLRHLARHAEKFGAGGVRRQGQVLEPLRPVIDDMGNAGQGLDIVHQVGCPHSPLSVA